MPFEHTQPSSAHRLRCLARWPRNFLHDLYLLGPIQAGIDFSYSDRLKLLFPFSGNLCIQRKCNSPQIRLLVIHGAEFGMALYRTSVASAVSGPTSA